MGSSNYVLAVVPAIDLNEDPDPQCWSGSGSRLCDHTENKMLKISLSLFRSKFFCMAIVKKKL